MTPHDRARAAKASARAAQDKLSTTPAAAAAPSQGRYYTPLVSKLAVSLAVDLATVSGTGVGGRVTARDVRAAAAGRRPAAAPATAAARGARSSTRSLKRTFESQFTALDTRGSATGIGIRVSRTVTVDAYAANPLADEMRQAVPENFAAARRATGEEPPTLFAGGDLPLFTTAGFDPNDLLALPWVARHAAARASASEAADLFERFGETSEKTYWAAEMACGNQEGPILYRRRAAAWLAQGAHALQGGA